MEDALVGDSLEFETTRMVCSGVADATDAALAIDAFRPVCRLMLPMNDVNRLPDVFASCFLFGFIVCRGVAAVVANDWLGGFRCKEY